MPKKNKQKKQSNHKSHREGCHKCGKAFDGLPFRCKFCRESFCDKHRLPEDHSCLGLELRKEQLKERISKGERITYEPKVKRELRVEFHEPDERRVMRREKIAEHAIRDLTAPLIKSPMAIIGIIVAVLVIIAFIIAILS